MPSGLYHREHMMYLGGVAKTVGATGYGKRRAGRGWVSRVGKKPENKPEETALRSSARAISPLLQGNVWNMCECVLCGTCSSSVV